MTSLDDLWPADVGEPQVTAPVSILKEQARRLGSRTSWKVTADVQSSAYANKFRHVFIVYAKDLSYEYELFSLEHQIEFYPLSVYFEDFEGGRVEVTSEEEFAEVLGRILSSERTRKIIQSLVAQLV